MDREFILKEIKRTAAENGGKPLGRDTFRKETGIKDYDWTLYWNRFSDAQQEAGFKPNTFDNSYGSDELIKKIIELIRKLGRFPLATEIKRESRLNSAFPYETTFRKQLGGKAKMASGVISYCKNRTEFDDVVKICSALAPDKNPEPEKEAENVEKVGYVYLFQSGRRYKIGKSYDLDRRHAELVPQSPDEVKRVHIIKTDDPSGVEAYWHRRFQAKRTRGEWFALTSADVKAFKRWRNVY